MASPTSPQSSLPSRSATTATRSSTLSDDEAILGEDTNEVTRLFTERLRAWKHACGYLEEYIAATEKLHKDTGKEYNKVLKQVSKPLREGEHFDQQLGGVAGMFDNIRSNTQGISNSHEETAKALKGSVLPTFERLHSEIKNKSKELAKGAGKGGKAVDKARNSTQKHIELLGQHTASFDSTGGRVSAADDPYVLQRGVMHRLNKQITEENNNRQDLIGVQNSFAQFEAHVLQSIQQGLGQFNMVVTKQADATKNMYGDMVAVAQRIPLDFEWKGFVKRNEGILIDPSAPPRSVHSVSFPNQNHPATQPLIAGSLGRKSKITRRYDTSYWVVTPSKYLHEFKTDDDFAKDPSPETSLHLPDCAVGAVQGEKFAVKGKDMSRGKIGSAVAMNHEYQFKAHTATDASKWWEVIRTAAGQVTNEPPETSAPTSPVSKTGSADSSLAAVTAGSGAAATSEEATAAEKPHIQTQNITDGEKVMSPTSASTDATPPSATAGPHEGVAAADHSTGQTTGFTGATGTTSATNSVSHSATEKV